MGAYPTMCMIMSGLDQRPQNALPYFQQVRLPVNSKTRTMNAKPTMCMDAKDLAPRTGNVNLCFQWDTG
jgi:hypothetical protein